MGAKDSKPSCISYEDAVRRVSDSELRRIREAFKRYASGNGTCLSLDVFIHEVLCDGVPTEVAEWLFQACGGTKRGISFKDLLCGVVVLTKGSKEEKIKFLWTLYVNNQNENGLYIYKWDFARTLHLENTSLAITNAPKTAEILTGLFGAGEKVSFEQFRSWLLIHKEATVLSKWLLSDRSYNSCSDLETPTFYQSLAGVTHLEERDIIELEKCFWSLRNSAATGQLDAESLSPLLSPPLPPAAVSGTFLAFDENRDGHVDFKELCCGLSAACRGPRTERLKFCFKIFDLDRDGALNKKELIDMVSILCQVANESIRNQSSRSSTPDGSGNGNDSPDKCFEPEAILLNLKEKLTNLPKRPVFHLGPASEDQGVIEVKEESEQLSEMISKDMALTHEEFLIWSIESAEVLLSPFLDLIYEVCHVVLGLRPQCRHQERDIVMGWLRRASCRGYSVGQFWYLVSREWWTTWGAWSSSAPDNCCRLRHDDHTDDSFTTNSTESMGSLLYRCDSASLGSASSSGVSSGGGQVRHPGTIDNRRLLAHNQLKVRTLTGEGGHLRRDVTLSEHRDFELVPDALWRALALWYGGPDPLPRQVIRPPNSDIELELYPLHMKIYRHASNSQRMKSVNSMSGGGGSVSVYNAVPLSGAMSGAMSGSVSVSGTPEKYLAYTAAFSRCATVKQVSEFLSGALGLAREDMRLWLLGGGGGELLDDDSCTLAGLEAENRPRLLLELRNHDLTWPEEIGALSLSSSSVGGGGGGATSRRGTCPAPDVPGATGLHNLGNTCYMNAALQSVWHTGALTRYFNSGMHLYELNTRNPLGTKGALALRYGELCKEVWCSGARSVAPLRVRWCVSRHARTLAGGGQHDAQELLAWLLDTLHEDLNRPAAPDRRALRERHDQAVAKEAWDAHTARNSSIMTELFYGQLKSRVRCASCAHESVRFDAYNMLSLPLPMETCVPVEVRVILLDGSVPIKYGVQVNSEGTYLDLKTKLSQLCNLPPELMLLVEVSGALIGRVIPDSARVKPRLELVVYELPPETDTQPLDEWCPNGAGATASGVPGGGQVAAAGGVGCGEAEGGAEVSGVAASLCMPALFCFKRSRSEIVMSASPSGLYEHLGHTLEHTLGQHSSEQLASRANTLPKNLRRPDNRSPTLSVKSLNLRPNSPRLGKVKFGSSPSNMHQMDRAKEPPIGKITYLVAVHRKQCRLDAYFLSSQRSRPALFGVPLLVPLREGISGREMYATVWTQLARLLSARPSPADTHNHATDCDDSLGYEFPFTLRLVSARSGGMWCATCPWSELCRGCVVPCRDHPLVCNTAPEPSHTGTTPRPQKRASTSSNRSATQSNACIPDSDSPIAKAKLNRQYSARTSIDSNSEVPDPSKELTRLDLNQLRALWCRGGGTGGGVTPALLAIDWDPTALHLRYQSTREKACIEHPSVRSCLVEAARPVDLDHCLTAFTSDERLEEPYHCSGCRSAQPATKKLQIWRLPPILIIHLKRFQYVNNKWIKSQKVVNFPFKDFDPTAYLASVPQETILRHNDLKSMVKRRASMYRDIDDHISESDDDDEDTVSSNHVARDSNIHQRIEKRNESVETSRERKRLESTSLMTSPVMDDNLIDYHQHHLTKDQDPFDLKYRLYAVVSHSGEMSGGHYVAYTRSPSGAWLCYNDSMCRQLCSHHDVPPIDPASAYLLFYERQGLDCESYLPDITDKEPVIKDSGALDPDESDLKKMCTIM